VAGVLQGKEEEERVRSSIGEIRELFTQVGNLQGITNVGLITGWYFDKRGEKKINFRNKEKKRRPKSSTSGAGDILRNTIYLQVGGKARSKKKSIQNAHQVKERGREEFQSFGDPAEKKKKAGDYRFQAK